MRQDVLGAVDIADSSYRGLELGIVDQVTVGLAHVGEVAAGDELRQLFVGDPHHVRQVAARQAHGELGPVILDGAELERDADIRIGCGESRSDILHDLYPRVRAPETEPYGRRPLTENGQGAGCQRGGAYTTHLQETAAIE